MSNFIQFDNSKTIVGGINIVEAKKFQKKIVFNESYTVTGKILTAPAVFASYDLTVIGDMEVEIIEVRGNLYVMGNIKANSLVCSNVIICNGTIEADAISASEIVANNITCCTIECPGNIVARTTIDIKESLKSDSSVMTGEGIIGNGEFTAKNAVAAEYFDFDGEVVGKVLELETDAVFGKPNDSIKKQEGTTVEELATRLKELIITDLTRFGDDNEIERLATVITNISEIDEDLLSDWKYFMENLINISESDEITNLRDYLVVIMAAKYLPVKVLKHKSIQHVFDKLLVNALGKIDTLPFEADDLDDLIYALKIVALCEDEIMIDKEEAINRILKYVGAEMKIEIIKRD